MEDAAVVERGLVAPQLIQRLGTPEQVSTLACLLASDDAGWITGAACLIEGGALARRGVHGSGDDLPSGK